MASRNDDVCPQSTTDRTARIARLNDLLRRGLGKGQVFMTSGVVDMGQGALLDIMTLVRDFDDFSANNDPHGEHDFGAFSYRGEKLFWKIDYYDQSLTYGSDDPADEAVTTRVLTVMLAREY